jgi:uncharacterized membrane protein
VEVVGDESRLYTTLRKAEGCDPMAAPARGGPTPEVETGRLEAFSDGVFAVAITLLVFNLHTPSFEELRTHNHTLLRELADQWSSYLAYVLSFVTILIMWVNHHTVFKCVKRTDHVFLLLNGLLLLCITAIPFPTQMLATYIQQPDAKVAQVIYSGTFLVAACVYNAMWFYAAKHDRLIGEGADRALVEAISGAYRFGPPLYLIAFVVAFISAGVSLAICIALAVFFALPNRTSR